MHWWCRRQGLPLLAPQGIRLKKLIALAFCVAGVVGCSGGTASEVSIQESAPTGVETVQSAVGNSDQSSAAVNLDPLHASFAELSANIPGSVGVAIAGGDGVWVFGQWAEGPAWSTMKVPLAIAGLRQSNESTTSLVAQAIKQSDNAAAEAIWSQLGDPVTAADAVQTILREAGDSDTVVQSERIRPEFTAFGQTTWPVAAQARFAAALPCLASSEIVLADMRTLAANQRWGLATRADAATKGGWGPTESGSYLVRQMAAITTDSGTLGVALAVAPADGRFDTGVEHIGRLAAWVGEHVETVEGRKCQQ